VRLPQSYASTVGASFPGEAPSATGYAAWLAARPVGSTQASGALQLYTASSVAFVPKEFSHDHGTAGWLPGGTVVPATGPLPAP
jgi:hypothetical protein